MSTFRSGARVRPLLNRSEAAVDEVLQESVEGRQARIVPKARLADVLDLDRPDISGPLRSYALKAHFDFVLVEGRSHRPQFAVEFDGPSHETLDARRRDGMKDALCRACSFPLLRINFGFVIGLCDPEPVLRYLCDLWFDACSQDELRRVGLLEPAFGAHWYQLAGERHFAFFHRGKEFDHRYSIAYSDPSDDDEPLIAQSADLSAVTRWMTRDAFRQGIIPKPGPLLISKAPTDDSPGEAFAVLEVRPKAYVVGHAKFGTFNFPLIEPRELVKDLAVLDLKGPYLEWLVGVGIPIGMEQRTALEAETAGWIREH